MAKLKIINSFKRRWQKKSKYKKSLTIFTIFLIVCAIAFLIHTYRSMVIYERNQVDNYIRYLASSGKITENIKDDLFIVSKYEKGDKKISHGAKKLFQNDKLNIKKNIKESTNDVHSYDLYLDDRLLSTVNLRSSNHHTRMTLLTIEDWEVDSIKTYFDKGLFSYTITIPRNYKLFINNEEVKEEAVSKNDALGLERVARYVDVASSKTYEINYLVNEPKIKIVDDNNKNIEFTCEKGNIVINSNFKEFKTLEEAKEYIKGDFDIMKLAKNYSLFLTNDLGGERHGFYKLSPYLIKDSYMYEMAWGWATQVDITFVSAHRLKNPTFTNESLKNFIIYSDDAFSVEVYLEKNMVVLGQDRVDTMNDRLYFVYYDGGYKLVDMKSIKE